MNIDKSNKAVLDLTKLLMALAGLTLLFLLSQKFYFRIDLTSDKRHTVSESSKIVLEELDDLVYVQVYLDGELNIQLNKFQNSIRETLEELRIHGKPNFEYDIIDPFEGLDNKARNQMLTELHDKGLQAVNMHHKAKDGTTSEKLVIPGAMVRYKDVELPVNLLQNIPSLSSEENFNLSVSALEYQIISTVKNISNANTEKIAFIEGHGELQDVYLADIMKELSKTFQIDRGRINGQPGILDNYKAIIIAGPTLAFSEADKFVIDQYIMKGGKVAWILNGVQTSMDSLAYGVTPALPLNLNLEDQLFRYGVRINPVLLQDIQSNLVPINVALEGSNPDFKPFPWYYHPLVNPSDASAISKNINLVLCRFASTIDTVGSRSGVEKTVLLSSSQMSKVSQAPTYVSLDEVRKQVSKAEFNQSGLIVALALEGQFESVFKNRMVDSYIENAPQIITESPSTKMIIIADGDLIRNDVRETPQGPVPMPLGFDRYTQQKFGNKQFLSNAISFLTDEDELLELRGREFKLRLLDKSRIQSERQKWQMINLLTPLVIIALSGLLYAQWRKRKYGKQQEKQ